MDAKTRRRVLLGLAHKAAAQLGMDEDTRRAAQMAFCGKASLADYSDSQLIGWCWELKRRGAEIGIPAPPPKGGSGWGRPTEAQLAEIERLALRIGWSGLDDGALRGFVRRTCAADDVRFITRGQATAVISGLRRWLAQRQRHAGQEVA
ncbi:regulatory protein GemA [Thiobacter aerophilum]|uniref:Regulatory protein GemA n=1 Tax=Thiobacter aerophilum TaxID=3121275 RepID=A0ABV0EDV6_9BURK